MFSACWRPVIPLIYMYFTIWTSDNSSECGMAMSWWGAALWQKQLSLAELCQKPTQPGWRTKVFPTHPQGTALDQQEGWGWGENFVNTVTVLDGWAFTALPACTCIIQALWLPAVTGWVTICKESYFIGKWWSDLIHLRVLTCCQMKNQGWSKT